MKKQSTTYNSGTKNTTLATKYYVTRDPESEFPELSGVRGIIIDENPHDEKHYTVTVWGNGVPLEQALNEASSVVRFSELGSVVADLDEIRAAITDDNYRAWMASNQTHDGTPTRNVAAMARELCEEFVLNAIETAKGVVDITADVVADQKAGVA